VIEGGSADSAPKVISSAPAKSHEPPRGPAVENETADQIAAASAPSSAPAIAARQTAVAEPAVAAPVIPLVHAPDDPGPDEAEEAEPSAEPQNASWRKMFE
jgi:HemY protein